MLNSLRNNPGDGKENEVTTGNASQQEEPVIQEVFEEEPDDYNYVPQIQEVDEEEIRNLSAIREETTVDKRVYYVCAGFLLAALIGGGIGMGLAANSAGNADVARKSSLATVILKTTEDKLSQFDEYVKSFESALGTFDRDTFDAKIANYSSYSFMLDISSEVTSEVVLLAGDSRANPLAGLRKYSADTMLLTQLISSHINETHADAEAIMELQDRRAAGGEENVMYAMQIVPEGVTYLMTTAPRTMYANGAIGVYTYKDVIDDDEEASRRYSKLKIDGKWSQFQRERRDFVAEKVTNEKGDLLDVPNRQLHVVMDRRGNENLFFADEIVLVDRAKFFGKSMDALERYEQRTAQIKALIETTRADSKTIVSDLRVFMTEQDIQEYEKNKAGAKKGAKADGGAEDAGAPEQA
jgi:F0F1-type ATP synthase membrane subunit c/vacuolar-type H+-ATPase subunit K